MFYRSLNPNTIIVYEAKFNATLSVMREDGADQLLVISDFDGTLTSARRNGAVVGSNAVIRRTNVLGEEFGRRSLELSAEYHAYEVDPDLSPARRHALMAEWHARTIAMLIEFGLTRGHVSIAAGSLSSYIRQYTDTLLHLLRERRVPLIVMSAGHGDIIEGALTAYGAAMDHVRICANRYVFGVDGRVTGVVQPAIHSCQKDGAMLRQRLGDDAVISRRNVVIVGDNLTDLAMVDDLACENVIKIGLLSENVERQLPAFRAAFDVVVLGDGSLLPVTAILYAVLGLSKG